MDNELLKEQELLNAITKAYDVKGNVIRKGRVEVFVKKELIPSVLLYVKEQKGYKHLSHVACIDWIEQGEFQLTFNIWSHADKIMLYVKTRIDRENPVMENLDGIWDQLNTYEREFREMFGIEFTGLVGEKEFILEDWDDMPPMRRDFDTVQYSKDHYYFRPGREDAKDVRKTLTDRTGEEIPDYATKYSREK